MRIVAKTANPARPTTNTPRNAKGTNAQLLLTWVGPTSPSAGAPGAKSVTAVTLAVFAFVGANVAAGWKVSTSQCLPERTSVTYEFAAYKVENDLLMVTAQQALVFVDLDERKACPIPDWYREKIGAFEGEDLES